MIDERESETYSFLKTKSVRTDRADLFQFFQRIRIPEIQRRR